MYAEGDGGLTNFGQRLVKDSIERGSRAKEKLMAARLDTPKDNATDKAFIALNKEIERIDDSRRRWKMLALFGLLGWIGLLLSALWK